MWGQGIPVRLAAMMRIDVATSKESVLAWIGDCDRGACFFMAPDCCGRKRRRDHMPAEDEAESSGMDERSGESRAVEDTTKMTKVSGAWGRMRRQGWRRVRGTTRSLASCSSASK